MYKTLKIACIQSQPNSSIDYALSEALDFAKNAVSNGVEFLFFPEYCGGILSKNGKLKPPAMPEKTHTFLLGMQSFAKQNKVWIMIGSIAVTAQNGKIFNRGFVLDSSGKIISRYDKIHMLDIQLSPNQVIRESTFVSPGNEAAILKTPLGLIGHSICYDLRFPELYRKIAQAGAEIICVPSAFTKKTGEAHPCTFPSAGAQKNKKSEEAHPCTFPSVGAQKQKIWRNASVHLSFSRHAKTHPYTFHSVGAQKKQTRREKEQTAQTARKISDSSFVL